MYYTVILIDVLHRTHLVEEVRAKADDEAAAEACKNLTGAEGLGMIALAIVQKSDGFGRRLDMVPMRRKGGKWIQAD